MSKIIQLSDLNVPGGEALYPVTIGSAVTVIKDNESVSLQSVVDQIPSSSGGGGGSSQNIVAYNVKLPANGSTAPFISLDGGYTQYTIKLPSVFPTGWVIGNINSSGQISGNGSTAASGDKLLIAKSADGEIDKSVAFGSSQTTFLRNDGQWAAPSVGLYTIGGLSDVTINGASNGQVLTYSNGNWINSAVPTELPSLTGNANKILAVNSSATGVEWVTDSGGGTTVTLPPGYNASTGITLSSSALTTIATVGNVELKIKAPAGSGSGGSVVTLPSGYSASSGITIGSSLTTLATVDGVDLNVKASIPTISGPTFSSSITLNANAQTYMTLNGISYTVQMPDFGTIEYGYTGNGHGGTILGQDSQGGNSDTNNQVTIASGDRLVIGDWSDKTSCHSGAYYPLKLSSITFGSSTTTFLRNDGQWATPSGGGGGGGSTVVAYRGWWSNTPGTIVGSVEVDNVTTRFILRGACSYLGDLNSTSTSEIQDFNESEWGLGGIRPYAHTTGIIDGNSNRVLIGNKHQSGNAFLQKVAGLAYSPMMSPAEDQVYLAIPVFTDVESVTIGTNGNNQQTVEDSVPYILLPADMLCGELDKPRTLIEVMDGIEAFAPKE